MSACCSRACMAGTKAPPGVQPAGAPSIWRFHSVNAPLLRDPEALQMSCNYVSAYPQEPCKCGIVSGKSPVLWPKPAINRQVQVQGSESAVPVAHEQSRNLTTTIPQPVKLLRCHPMLLPPAQQCEVRPGASTHPHSALLLCHPLCNAPPTRQQVALQCIPYNVLNTPLPCNLPPCNYQLCPTHHLR